MNKEILQFILRHTAPYYPPTQPAPEYNVWDSLSRYIIVLLFVVLLVSPIIMLWIWGYRKYTNSEYAQATNNSIMQVLFDKGTKGEFLLFQQADKLIEGERHWLFNVYIPRANGKTTEIDAILFHSSGIYIFESKNYGGWIFGSEDQEYWTQCLKPSRYSPTQKYKFYNPLKQNQLHIKSYKAYLQQDLKNIPIHSVVVFGNRAVFRDIQLSSYTHCLTTQANLPYFLDHIIYNTPPVSMGEINEIYKKTIPLSRVSDDVKQQHIENIRSNMQANTGSPLNSSHSVLFPSDPESSFDFNHSILVPPAAQANLCPKCGGQLVRRTAKKGPNQGKPFIGCSNFPKCRYTKQI